MRALLVDGQDLFRSALRTLLEAHGASVVGEAQNGHEAVEMTHQLYPEVVLMDLDRLELDGLPAIRLITAEMPEVKVIVLTASKAADLEEGPSDLHRGPAADPEVHRQWRRAADGGGDRRQ